MSRSDEVMSSISLNEIAKKGDPEDSRNSYIPTSESESDNNIDLCLSLGGLYGMNVSKDMKDKKKMYPEYLNSAVESVSANPALCRAMDMLKSNCFPSTLVPLTIQDPSPIITAEKDFKNPLKNAEVNQIQNPDLMTMMPSLSIKGDGLYKRKIEGFLFSCSEKKNVNIVCLCHGKIMSPAGFIKHAGGIERENPMEYIKVMTTPSQHSGRNKNGH